MSSLNYGYQTNRYTSTYEGARVPQVSVEKQLMRMTLAHMLWENQFYVDGVSSATKLTELAAKCSPEYVASLAREARSKFKLRHVPLALLREVARKGQLKALDLAAVIQRPDEMGEFLSIYWKDGRKPISNQVKKGLATAFAGFNEYQLAKWDKNSANISVRDVMFLTHPKPKTSEQEAMFKRIAEQKLETPDTWEVQLSGGADKKETFERLMAERKLGALAFIRNLRNMEQAGVSEVEIRAYASKVNVERVLPFRFIAAARMVPKYEDMLEQMMFKCLEGQPKLPGKTVLMVDISGSMFGARISAKSDLERFDAAAALAVLCREVCESVEIFSYSNNAVRVPPRRGFALVEAIRNSQGHGGTYLGGSLKTVSGMVGKADRVIVFTDEQSADTVNKPFARNGYVINVAAYQNGVNHSDWVTITGFSEAVLDYIQALESV